MGQRELIERDQKYIAVKDIILSVMDNQGVTAWLNDNEWVDLIYSQGVMRTLPKTQYYKILNDMLDDSEIVREYDRDTTPNLKRWVMREKWEYAPK